MGLIQPPDQLKLGRAADEWSADTLLRDKKYQEAFLILSRLEEHNSPYAMVALGWIYENGYLGEVDLISAEYYYSRAVSLNYSEGFVELGRLKHRIGLDKEAREIFSAGAKIGNISCMARLGAMMAAGEGGKKSNDEAIKILTLPAKIGNPIAKRALYQIEFENSSSIFRVIIFYSKVLILIISTIYFTLKDPYSERSMR